MGAVQVMCKVMQRMIHLLIWLVNLWVKFILYCCSYCPCCRLYQRVKRSLAAVVCGPYLLLKRSLTAMVCRSLSAMVCRSLAMVRELCLLLMRLLAVVVCWPYLRLKGILAAVVHSLYLRLMGPRGVMVSSESDEPTAVDALSNFLNTHKKYRGAVEMNCLGSRLHKYWFKADVDSSDCGGVVMTASLASNNCRLKLNTETLQSINELLTTINPHPLLHRVLELSYNRSFKHVIVVQDYCAEGSLKDMIYKMASPDSDWTEKYCKRSKGLPSSTVALYGRQILEAMMFLYRHGFPLHQLGHVQSGNIFVSDNTCRLGGYESTLVGYRTRVFRLCRQYEECIDIVMFGHLLFEMSCGYELTSCFPGKKEYQTIKDKELKSTLKYIFEKGFPHSIEEISNTKLFKDQEVPTSMDRTLSGNCQLLLETVKSNPPQQQDPPETTRRQPSSMVRPRCLDSE